MKRREFLALAGAAAAFPRVAWGQQTKVPHVAVLGLPLAPERSAAIRLGLADHGYIDGKNIIVESFLAPTTDDIPTYAAMAVGSMPDVILCGTTPAAQSAKNLTGTIPIVMLGLNDPVGNGLVANLAHPGGNVTGNTLSSSDVVGKQLGLVKELVPTLRRLAVLDVPADPSAALLVAQVRLAARLLNIEPVVLDFAETQDFATQLERVATSNVQAFQVTPITYLSNNADASFQFELRTKIPRMNGQVLGVGPFQGVMEYTANNVALYRQSGDYVDAILKGIKPADLPVQQPTIFDLAVNLSTAKVIGLSIPASILAQATMVTQ